MLRLLFLFAISPPALSAEMPSFLPVSNISGTAQVAVPLYTQSQCEDILRPIAEPEAVIAKGLDALSKLSKEETQSCLGEVVALWEKAVPELKPDSRQAAGHDYWRNPEYTALSERRKLLNMELDCTLPADPLAQENFKKGFATLCKATGFFSRETFEAKQAEEKALKEKIQILEASGQMKANFASKISSGMLPDPVISPRMKELRELTQCYEYAGLARCAGKDLSPESRDTVKAEYGPLLKKFSEDIDQNASRRNALRNFFSFADNEDPRFNRSALMEQHRKNTCLESGKFPPYSTYCEKEKLPVKGEGGEFDAELLKLRPEAIALADSLLADPEATKARWLQKNRENTRDLEEKYGLRRMLSHYHAYLRNNAGKPGSLAAFCAENIRSQSNTARYAKEFDGLLLLSREPHWRWANLFGYSEADISAIQEYTGAYYQDINQALWKAHARKNPTPLIERHRVFEEALSSALKKAPVYEGKVMRYSRLPQEVLAQHKVGAIVTYEGFTSTSKNTDWTWESDSEEPVHRFVITSYRSGVDIAELSNAESEGEVLFPPGVRFKVLSRKPRKDGQKGFDFVLVEVNEKAHAIGKAKR